MRALWLGATIATLGAALCAGPAAADGLVVKRSDPYVYVAPDALPIVYSWSGIYIGGHLGAAYARNEFTFDDPNDLFAAERVGGSNTSFAGGGHIGLQKQWSWIVVGAEVAWTFMDQPLTTSSAFQDVTIASNSHSVLAVTGKFGWAWDNILAYFKGGYATTDIDSRATQTSNGTLLTSSSQRAHGWTAGAGIEYAIWQHVILGVEYNYTKFNVDLTPPGAIPAGVDESDTGIDIQSVTARLSFKFGGGWPEPMLAK